MSESSMELGSINKDVTNSKIDLESLSSLVGFPIEYLKQELLFEKDEISIEELRLSMLSFLETNFSH